MIKLLMKKNRNICEWKKQSSIIYLPYNVYIFNSAVSNTQLLSRLLYKANKNATKDSFLYDHL